MGKETIVKISELINLFGVSFEVTADAMRKAATPMRDLRKELKQLNWEINLRPKEVHHLKIKALTMGLTYSERKRLEGIF